MNFFTFSTALILTLTNPIVGQATIAFPHSVEEFDAKHPLYPVTTPQSENFLQVSEFHSLYYATYGNPKGIPVVILHGGPGAGCSDDMTKFFNLDDWFVVMFDQRGAMRSQPFASMESNTPQESVEDIEKLRKYLGVDQWVVFGGSWGSTLALLYGEEHPERCLGFILRGIFLGREQDYLHLFYGMGKIFPEAYDALVNFIPEDERSDLLKAYYVRVMDPNPQIHMPAARAFMRFDAICSTHAPDIAEVEEELENDNETLSVARAFLYYAYNNFFLETDQLLSRVDNISHLPAIIVQGRWDAICLPDMAYALYRKWENCNLKIASFGGHSSSDPAIAAGLAMATEAFVTSLYKSKMPSETPIR